MSDANCDNCTPANRGATKCEAKSFVIERCYATDRDRKCGAKALHKYTINADCSVTGVSYENGLGAAITASQFEALDAVPCNEGWSISCGGQSVAIVPVTVSGPNVTQPTPNNYVVSPQTLPSPVTVSGENVTQPTPNNFVVTPQVIPVQKDGCELFQGVMSILTAVSPLATHEILVNQNGVCKKVVLSALLADKYANNTAVSYNAATGVLTITERDETGALLTPISVTIPVSDCTPTAAAPIQLCPGEILIGCGGQRYAVPKKCSAVVSDAAMAAPLIVDLPAVCALGGAITPTVWRNAYSGIAPNSSSALGGGFTPDNPWVTAPFAVTQGEVLIIAVAYSNANTNTTDFPRNYTGTGLVSSTSALLGPMELVSTSSGLQGNFWAGAVIPTNGTYVIRHFAARVLGTGNAALTFTVPSQGGDVGRFTMVVNAGTGSYPASGPIVRQHAEILGNAADGSQFNVVGVNTVPLFATLASAPIDTPLWSISGIHMMSTAFDSSGLAFVDLPALAGVCNMGIATKAQNSQSYGPAIVVNDSNIPQYANPNEVSGIELNVVAGPAGATTLTALNASVSIQNTCDCATSMVATTGFSSGSLQASLAPLAAYELSYEINGVLVGLETLSNPSNAFASVTKAGTSWNSLLAPLVAAGSASPTANLAVKVKCINHVLGSTLTINPYTLYVLGTT